MALQKSNDKNEITDSFERSLKRLEEIVQYMERGEATLDETIRMYEEGIGLSKRCLEQLQKVELKLRRLSKDVNGKFELIDERLED